MNIKQFFETKIGHIIRWIVFLPLSVIIGIALGIVGNFLNHITISYVGMTGWHRDITLAFANYIVTTLVSIFASLYCARYIAPMRKSIAIRIMCGFWIIFSIINSIFIFFVTKDYGNFIAQGIMFFLSVYLLCQEDIENL